MFPADLFSIIENIINTLTGFLFSIAYSIVTLARHPKSGPRYLQRRLANPTLRQVGPLTLHFFFFLAALICVYLKTVGSFDDIFQMFVEEDKISLASLLLTCIAATAVVNWATGSAALLGWPRRFSHQKQTLRDSAQNRKIRAAYSLVTSTAAFPIIFAITLGLISIYYKLAPRSSTDADLFPSLGLLSSMRDFTHLWSLLLAFAASLLLARMSMSPFLHGLFWESRGLPRRLARESIFFLYLALIISTVELSWSYTVRVYPPEKKDAIALAKASDLRFSQVKCFVSKIDKSLTISALIFNNGKRQSFIYDHVSITTMTKSSENVFNNRKSMTNFSDKQFYDIISINSGSVFHFIKEKVAMDTNYDLDDYCSIKWITTEDETIYKETEMTTED